MALFIILRAAFGYLFLVLMVRIVGRRNWQQPDSWKSVYRATGDYQYELVLTHDNAVDVETTQAELRDGVLRVTLPKAAAAKARKIAVS